VHLLLRLPAGSVFYADPVTWPGKKGRPGKHGMAVTCAGGPGSTPVMLRSTRPRPVRPVPALSRTTVRRTALARHQLPYYVSFYSVLAGRCSEQKLIVFPAMKVVFRVVAA
jgi:hypothetical protein